jgi:uncharacterized coiled-coil DUF342 family protein
MQDYAASICKIWFGEPISVDNWFKKNSAIFNGVKNRISILEMNVQEWKLENKDDTNGKLGLLIAFLKNLLKEVNEIDETTTSNLEIISDHIDKIEGTISGLVKDFKDRFADKEKKFEKRLIPVTAEKYNELTANAAGFKAKSKELAEKEKKYSKQVTSLEDECSNVKELLEHLEKKNQELNKQLELSKKTLAERDRTSARSDELEGMAQSYSLMKARADELEKRCGQQDIE